MITIRETILNEGQEFSYNLSEFPEINTDSCSIDKITVINNSIAVASIIDSKHFSIKINSYDNWTFNVLLLLKYEIAPSEYTYKTFEIQYKIDKPISALKIKNIGTTIGKITIKHLSKAPQGTFSTCITDVTPHSNMFELHTFSSSAINYDFNITAGSTLYIISDMKTWANIYSKNQIIIDFEDAEIGGDISALINGNTTLPDYCFMSLFEGSKFKSVSKDLLSQFTTMSKYCFEYMFKDCVNLMEMPNLLATELAYGCYWGMFKGCTSLVNVEVLPATTVPNYAYKEMFKGCTSLKTYSTTSDWLYYRGGYDDISDKLTSVLVSKIPEGETLSSIGSKGDSIYVPEGYLGFISGVNYMEGGAVECTYKFENNQFVIKAVFKNSEGTITSEETYKLSEGQSHTFESFGTFSCNYNTELDCLVLETTNAEYGLIFQAGSFKYKSISRDFKATYFGINSCNAMFQNCTSFDDYISFETSPTLSESCFENMFSGCSSNTSSHFPYWNNLTIINNAPKAFKCMFKDNTSIKTISFPKVHGSENMFESLCENCTSLTNAYIYSGSNTSSSLIGNGIYNAAFKGCSSLTTLHYYHNTAPSETYTYHWVDGVTKSGTFTKSKYATWTDTAKGISYIPASFTIQTSTWS